MYSSSSVCMPVILLLIIIVFKRMDTSKLMMSWHLILRSDILYAVMAKVLGENSHLYGVQSEKNE